MSFVAHDFDRALAESNQAVEIAEAVGSQRVLAAGLCTIGGVHMMTGRLEQAEAELQRTLSLSRAVGDAAHQATSVAFIGFIKNWQGEFSEAMRLEHEAQRIAREHNLLIALLRSLFVGGIALVGRGDYEHARTALEEGLALAEQVDNALYTYRMLNTLGWLYSELGDLARALDLNQRSAEGARQHGDPEVIANAELNLADIFLSQGDLHLAQEYLDGVYRLAHDPATSDRAKWRYSTHLFASLGDLWLARGAPAKAEEFVDQCVDLATRTTSRKYLVKGWRLQGEIALARGQWDAARQWLQQAMSLAQTLANPTQLWKTQVALGQFYVVTKRPEAAQQAYGAADAVIAGVKADLHHLLQPSCDI